MALRKAVFLNLPREIRDQIYEELLRPDQVAFYGFDDTPLGCSKIFVLNRQIHLEALECVENCEHEIQIPGRRGRVFRSMFDFGMPNFFHSANARGRCHIPPKYCELQVLRFRRLSVNVLFDYHPMDYLNAWSNSSRYGVFASKFCHNVDQVLETLRKSQSLQSLRLKLRLHNYPGLLNSRHMNSINMQEEDVPPITVDSELITRVMEPLIQFAADRQIDLSVDSSDLFLVDGPILQAPEDLSEPTIAAIETDAVISEIKLLLHNLCTEPRKNDIFSITFLSPNRHPQETEPSYQLVPECRTCYAVFTHGSQLSVHLAENPSHMQSYKPKRSNHLFCRYPQRYAPEHICFTCAMPFETKTAKFKHHARTGHGRKQMIPRWTAVDQNKQTAKMYRGWGNRKTRKYGSLDGRWITIPKMNWHCNSKDENKCVTVRWKHMEGVCDGRCEEAMGAKQLNNIGDQRFAMRWGYPRNGGLASCWYQECDKVGVVEETAMDVWDTEWEDKNDDEAVVESPSQQGNESIPSSTGREMLASSSPSGWGEEIAAW